jgi:hypothetical protein
MYPMPWALELDFPDRLLGKNPYLIGGLLRPVRIPTSTAVWFLAVSLVGAAFAGLSGLVLVYSTQFLGSQQYGLPLVWKTRLERNCGGGGGPLDILLGCFSITTYQWAYFIFDALFYMGIGFAATLLSMRRLSLFAGVVIPVSATWITWAIAFFVSGPSQPGTWTNGLPIPWVGLFDDGWTYSWVGFTIDVALLAFLEYVLFFVYRGLRITASYDQN